MEKKILSIISKKFKIKKINNNSSPKNVDLWDSYGHLDLISEINKKFKIEISFEDTIKIKNVGDVIKICKKYVL